MHNKDMILDLSRVGFSRRDIQKGLVLPVRLTLELAEDLGIMTGDGSLNSKRKHDYEIVCSGDAEDEVDYYINYVSPLKCKLFNAKIQPRLINPKRQNEFGIRLWSKAIFNFYTQLFDFPAGKKECLIGVPHMIKESDEQTQASFIKGLFDTDGSLTFRKKNSDVYYYPIIKFTTMSQNLYIKIREILLRFGFNLWSNKRLRYDQRYDRTYFIYDIDISGEGNLNRWMGLIGFSNPKHLTKYLIWEKFGFCPIKTTLQHRTKILNGEIDPV